MADAPLMVSISGVRGIAGKSITPQLITRYVAAFARLQQTKFGRTRIRIAVGSDSRVSGPWLRRITQGVLMAAGVDVIDIGVVPTPTVQWFVLSRQLAGGLVVTSSHNPKPWNGLKFIDSDGLFVSPDGCQKLFALAADSTAAEQWAEWNESGSLQEIDNVALEHAKVCIELPFIDVERIRQRQFKVVVDCINGAGSVLVQMLRELLGCQVYSLNADASGLFAHEPEPLPENLSELCTQVVQQSADLGIAVDPDADRCVLIDETGRPLGEEYTLALAVEFCLGPSVGKRGAVCRNLSTSRAVDDVAAKYNCPVHATPVGEIHVAKRMVEVAAVIGGEGNGGVMLPDVHIGRDSLVATTLTLAHLCAYGGKISQLKASLPQYEIVKLKTSASGVDSKRLVAHFRALWEGRARLDDRDGLRIDGTDWWVHLRLSNTEPVVRVIAEAHTVDEATKKAKEFMDEVDKL